MWLVWIAGLLLAATQSSHAAAPAESAAAPLVLAVTADPSEIPLGGRSVITYTLTNTSPRPVSGCATGWDSFKIEARLDSFRLYSLPLGYLENDIFVLPGGKKLSWSVEVAFPKTLGSGSATFIGTFESDARCPGAWVGFVESAPITVTLVDQPHDVPSTQASPTPASPPPDR